jgi:hypothetical protein
LVCGHRRWRSPALAGGRVAGGRVAGGRVAGSRMAGGRVAGGRRPDGGAAVGSVAGAWRGVTRRGRTGSQASGYRFLVLRPVRIQAWREVNELPGRTLMRGGERTV